MQVNFSDSVMIPFLSLPEGLWRIFSRPQLQRGCLRSMRKMAPSLGVRLNKTGKSIRLHFSQGSLRRVRSSRATRRLSATCGVDLTRVSLTAGLEDKRPQERCLLSDPQVGVCDSAFCFCLNFHHLAFMDWQIRLRSLLWLFLEQQVNGLHIFSAKSNRCLTLTLWGEKDLVGPSASLNHPLAFLTGNLSPADLSTLTL